MSKLSSARQRVCVLGATGSIGTNTLDVLARHPDRYEVVALTAHGRVAELRDQCLQWKPRFAVVAEAGPAQALQRELRSAGLRTENERGKRSPKRNRDDDGLRGYLASQDRSSFFGPAFSPALDEAKTEATRPVR